MAWCAWHDNNKKNKLPDFRVICVITIIMIIEIIYYKVTGRIMYFVVF